jgi:hypothetical protein
VTARCCIRCDAPLEARATTIGDRTHRAWVRVCSCQGLNGCGWYWGQGREAPAVHHSPPAHSDDHIPAFDDPIPAKPGHFLDAMNATEPLTERRPA